MALVHHELCFGCGRTNLFGLLMEAEPAASGTITARCFIKQDHQGPEPGCAHDGIVAAALAEAMALAAGPTARAQRLEVQFHDRAPVGTFLHIEASVIPEREASAEARSEGRRVASARGTFSSK